MLEYEELLELVKKRRSTRLFKPDPIPGEYIERIIEVARWAPSGANSQPWEFIVVKDRETRGKICGVLAEFHPFTRNIELTREEGARFPSIVSASGPPGFLQAPVFIVVCGDIRTKEAYPMIVNAVYSEAESTFNSSLASAFLYMHLAAATLGLGSQWLTATAQPYAQPLLKGLLGIPKELEIYDTMVVGYPAGEPRPRIVREADEIIHHERYDKAKFRTEAQIKSFISDIHRTELPGSKA